jgi:hypothetical protein
LLFTQSNQETEDPKWPQAWFFLVPTKPNEALQGPSRQKKKKN